MDFGKFKLEEYGNWGALKLDKGSTDSDRNWDAG